MNYNTINDSMQKEITEIKAYIESYLESDIELIEKVSKYIIDAPSKKIRPMLVAIIGKALNLEKEKSYKLAVIIEFIHTATLLHDDVVDLSGKRRGKDTVNKVWGNEASVLVGDFIYSRSFQMMVSINDMKIMKVLADATNKISEGEVLQLLNSHNPDITEDHYFKVIEFKTAQLFEACGSIAGLINNTNEKTIKAYEKIGHHFGLIFQIADDILDYSGKPNEIGKNVGDDLSEGRVTLPLIYTIQKSNENQKEMIKNSIKTGDISKLPDIIQIMEDHNIVKKVKINAEKHIIEIKKILDELGSHENNNVIVKLAEHSINRNF